VGSGSAFLPTENLPHNRVYLFRLDVVGGDITGSSNTLAFSYYDSDPDSGDLGGDRTGADRFPIVDPDSPGDGRPSRPPFGVLPGSPSASPVPEPTPPATGGPPSVPPAPEPTTPPAGGLPPSGRPSSPAPAEPPSAGVASARPLVNVVADPGSPASTEAGLPDAGPAPAAAPTPQPPQPTQPGSSARPVEPELPHSAPGESPAASSAVPWLVAVTGFAVLVAATVAFWVRRRRL
jgi:hypothetical protein